jgi:hypothetical protein
MRRFITIVAYSNSQTKAEFYFLKLCGNTASRDRKEHPILTLLMLFKYKKVVSIDIIVMKIIIKMT